MAKRTWRNGGQALRQIDRGKSGAVCKRLAPNRHAGDARRKRDGGEAGTALERIVPDIGDAVRYRDGGKTAAAESSVSNGGQAIGQVDAAQ